MSISETVIPDNLAADGPWDFERVPAEAHADPDISSRDVEGFWITDGNGEVIASVFVVPGREAEAEANASLGAAQHLLAELKLLRAMSCLDENGERCSFEEFWPAGAARVDAIIAAAEGR